MRRFVAEGGRGVGSGLASATVGSGSTTVYLFTGGVLLSKMQYTGVALEAMSNQTHF